jgi:hypothetical protein
MSAVPAVHQAPKQLPATQDGSALMKIIEKAALDPSFDVAKLDHLLQVRERWAAAEARNAYNEAFASFKSEAIVVVKNRAVTDGPLKNKRYAELFSVVNAVTPLLSKYGLSQSWSVKSDKDWIEVTCSLRHVLGHSESVTIGGPADTGGAKNPIQARASTITYLERYTLKAVCGIAEQDEDNDGGLGVAKMDEGVLADHLAAIDGAADEKSLMSAFGKAWKAAETLNDMATMKKFGDRKEERKAKLGLK